MTREVMITGSIDIDRPVDEVFDFVADQRNELLYNRQMIASTKMTDGPLGVGTRFQARALSHGKPVDMLIELTEVAPPHLLRSSTHLAVMDLDGGLTFTAVPTGTRMCWTWQVHPVGRLRLMKPVVKAIGTRNERRIWTSLKTYLEHRTNPPAATRDRERQ